MSSLRNAVQRRNHRERAQPQEREKWGLLEKRKDYKLRAADHKLKQRKIGALKQKASERNEDEFYFGMMSSATEGGIKISKRAAENSGGGGKVLSQDVVKLMKTQDRAYIQTVLQRTTRERERLEQELIMGDVGVSTAPRGNKITFDEDGEDMVAMPIIHNKSEPLAFQFDSDDEGAADYPLGRAKATIRTDAQSADERRQHSLGVKRRNLESLKVQESKLSTALQRLDDQRAQMAGTTGGVNKNGSKFRQRQRKR